MGTHSLPVSVNRRLEGSREQPGGIAEPSRESQRFKGSPEEEELSEPNRDPQSQLCDKSEGTRAVQGKARQPAGHICHILFSDALIFQGF